MLTRIVEATSGPTNRGKFMVARFDSSEWARVPRVEGAADFSLLRQIGWTHDHVWVLDLQTGEGALFKHGGSAKADLDKHRMRVCSLFEPFLAWLYRQNMADLQQLPLLVDLPDVGFAPQHRRPGAEGE